MKQLQDMRKQWVLLFFLLGLIQQIHSQPGHRLGAGFGMGHLRWQDQAVSPILYGGYTTGGVHFYHSILRKSHFTHWAYTNLSGELHPSSVVLQPSLVTSSYHTLEASHHRRLWAFGPDKPDLFWGVYAKGQQTYHHHTEFRNSRNQRYFVGSLGMGLTLKHHVNFFGNETLLSAGVNLPLLGLAVRNSFGYPHPTPWISKKDNDLFSFLRGGKLYGPLGYSGLDFRGTMEVPIGYGWGVFANYRWTIQVLADANELQESAHHLSVGISYLLNTRNK